MDEISRKINILLNLEKPFIPKAEYVFRTFCKIIGLQPEFFYGYSLEDIHIYYGVATDDDYPVEIYHNPSTSDFFEQLRFYDEKDVHFYQYRNEHIPFLFSQKGILFHQTHSSLQICKDIFASAFFFLSCWEEYIYSNKKEHNKKKKNPATKKTFLAKIHNFYMIPIVDRYCEIFQKAIELSLPGYRKVNKWLEKDKFAISVSHILLNCLKQSNDYHKNIKQLKRLLHFGEKKRIQSTIFFPTVEGKKPSTPECETSIKYYIDHLTKADPEKNNISSRPHNIAIGQTQGIFSRRMESSTIINNSCDYYNNQNLDIDGYCMLGLPQHYSKLFIELEDTAISYDMSLFTQLNFGYRAGISFPFYPFNIAQNKPFKVLEVPPNVGLLSDHNCSSTFLSYLLHETCQHSSLLSIISDGSKIIEPEFRKILSFSIKRDGLATSPRFVAEKWLTL